MHLLVVNLVFSLTLLFSSPSDSLKVAEYYTKAYKYRNNSPDTAMALARKSVILAKDISDQYGQSVGYNVIGMLHKNAGDFDSAIFYYQKSLALRQELGLKKDQATIYVNIGLVRDRMGDYPQAIELYLRALSIQEEMKDSLNHARTLQNIATLYDKQGETDRAYKYNQKSLIIYQQLQNLAGQSQVLNNLGIIEYKREDYSKAKEHYEKSIELKEATGNNRGLANTYNNLGDVFMIEKSLTRATESYEKALTINQKLGNQLGAGSSFLKLARIYQLQGQVKEALRFVDRSIFVFENLGANDDLITAYFRKSEINKQARNYKQAILNVLIYDSLKTLVFNENKSRQIAELQTQYETEKKEKEILEQEAEIQQRTLERNNILYSSVTLLALAGVVLSFYFQRNRRMKLVNQRNAEVHKNEITRLLATQESKTFDALIEGQEKERSRVAEELHDRLGSTLSAAKMHLEAIDTNGAGEQHEYVGQLIDKAVEDTRQISHNMLSGVLTKFGLVAALNDLKETVNATNKINTTIKTIQFDERLEMEKELNIYRIIQELLSNTLKHSGAKKFSIILKKEDGAILLFVQDDGSGIAKESNGIGLLNVSSRVSKMNGTWEMFFDEGKGTRAEFNIPI